MKALKPFLLLVCFPFLLFSNSSKLWENNQPTLPLQNLLTKTDTPYDSSFRSIVNSTQKHWFQNKERWFFDRRFENIREDLLIDLKDLGCVEKLEPTKKHYDYVLVLGALLPRVRMRFNTLIQAWKSGVTFNHIVVLSGDRELHPTVETSQAMLDPNNEDLPFDSTSCELSSCNLPLPQNEAEMMQLVYQQAPMPETLRKVPVTFIKADKVLTDNQAYKRPSTKELVTTWLKHEKPCFGVSILAISNQPYSCFQHAVLKYYLTDFDLETIGEKASDTLPMAHYLDNLARWLYWEIKLFEGRSSSKESLS